MKKVTKKNRGVEAILKPYNEDVKRHMSVLSEEFQGRVKVIGEQYGSIQKTLESHSKTLSSHTEMIGKLVVDMDIVKTKLDSHNKIIGKLGVDMEIVKTNSEFMKDGLKKKVDYDEFIALERRVHSLEGRRK